MAKISTSNPLQQVMPIVNPKDGTPTPYMMRQMQLRQDDIAGAVPDTRLIETTSPLTGGGDLSEDRVIGMEDSGVTPGSYTSANITVDEFGRVTAAANGSGGGGGGFTQIAQVVIGSAVATISFSTIPATHNDLIVIITGRSTGASTDVNMNFNGDTGNNYDWRVENRFSTSTGSATNKILAGQLNGTGAPAAIPSPLEIEIYGYAQTAFDKTVMSKGMVSIGTGGTNLVFQNGGSTWLSTAAINAILLTSTSTFSVGTVATLYGR